MNDSTSGKLANLTTKEAFDIYESGKHRRYSLLFAVNGGAFAVAKLFAEEPAKQGRVLGDLSLTELAIGMSIFTVVMVWDMYHFGQKMRTSYLQDAFGPQGKLVLFVLGALLFTGWLLVGAKHPTGA